MVSLVFRCVCFVARLLVTCDLLFRADCLLAFVVYFCGLRDFVVLWCNGFMFCLRGPCCFRMCDC